MLRMSAGTSPWTWSSCHWASWLEASTTVRARSTRRAWKASHRSWSSVAGGEQVGEHGGVLQRLRAALGERGRAGVRGVADHHDPAPVPRRGQQVGLEPGVVDPGGVGERLADLVPRPVVGAGQASHGGQLLVRGQRGTVLGVLDDVGVEGVLAGGAVAGDVGRAAVEQVGAGDARRPRTERPPDAHPDRPSLQHDAQPGGSRSGPRRHRPPGRSGRWCRRRRWRRRRRRPGRAPWWSSRTAPGRRLRRAVVQQAGQVGAGHAHHGRVVRAAGPGVGHLERTVPAGSGARMPVTSKG